MTSWGNLVCRNTTAKQPPKYIKNNNQVCGCLTLTDILTSLNKTNCNLANVNTSIQPPNETWSLDWNLKSHQKVNIAFCNLTIGIFLLHSICIFQKYYKEESIHGKNELNSILMSLCHWPEFDQSHSKAFL